MAQLPATGDDKGISDFERGLDTGEFLLAQAPPQKSKAMVIAPPDLREEADLHARFTFGPRTAVRLCGSMTELRSILAGVKALDDLHFMLHGGAGQVQVGNEELFLREITKSLQGARVPVIRTITFMNCLVMAELSGVPTFGRLFGVERVIGFNAFRGLIKQEFNGLGKDGAANAKKIRTLLHGFDRFLLPGTNLEELPPGKSVLLLEAWFKGLGGELNTFKRDLSDPEVFPLGFSANSPYTPRSEAIHEVIPVGALEAQAPGQPGSVADEAAAALAATRALREICVSFQQK